MMTRDKMKKSFMLISLFFVMVAAGEIWGMRAASAAPFYEGKKIVFVVNASPGGGTDLFARMYARFLPRFIPGHPSIIIENQAGGAGVIATNYLYNKAKPDGLTVGTVTNGDIGLQMMEREGVKYDVTKMPIIAAMVEVYFAYLRSDLTGITRPGDLLKTNVQLIGGVSALGNPIANFQDIFMSEILGIKSFRLTAGWKGAGDRRIAFERGELNFHTEPPLMYRAAVLPLVKQGKVLILFQNGIIKSDGTIVRTKTLQDVPTAEEFYKELFGRAPSGIAWEVLKQQIMAGNIAKTLALPPGTPDSLVMELRQAIRQLWRDPEWLKESEKMFGIAQTPPDTLSGEETQEMVKMILNPPKEVKEFILRRVQSK